MPLTTEDERAERFVWLLTNAHGHKPEFRFKLMSYPYEWIKLALEQEGFSVHQDVGGSIVAFRVRPDLCPGEPASSDRSATSKGEYSFKT